MSGPTPLSPRVLFCCCVVLMAGMGCAQEEHEERASVYSAGSALLKQRGQRVVLQDAKGQATLKLRVRAGAIKVYDASFRPLGVVRVRPGHVQVEPFGAKPWDVSFEAGAQQVQVQDALILQKQPERWVLQALPSYDQLGALGPRPDGGWSLRAPGRPDVIASADALAQGSASLLAPGARVTNAPHLLLLTHPEAPKDPLLWVAASHIWGQLAAAKP